MENKEMNEVQPDETVKHWYCFSYLGTSIDDGHNCYVSIYSGNPRKGVTMPMINHNKKEAGVNNNAVLIGCMYLGEMTKADFLGHNAELSGQPQV